MSLHDALAGFESIFSQLGADKGLANFDQSSELESLLKSLVNSMKNLLSSMTTLTENIPGLGPAVAPGMCSISMPFLHLFYLNFAVSRVRNQVLDRRCLEYD